MYTQETIYNHEGGGIHPPQNLPRAPFQFPPLPKNHQSAFCRRTPMVIFDICLCKWTHPVRSPFCLVSFTQQKSSPSMWAHVAVAHSSSVLPALLLCWRHRGCKPTDLLMGIWVCFQFPGTANACSCYECSSSHDFI